MNKKKFRHSVQRDNILELLRNNKSHPSANWVYEQLKERFPQLSLGNLYRNLNILVEQGLVKRVHIPGNDFDRFDAHHEDHIHFICQKCESIWDLDSIEHDSQIREIARNIPGSIESFDMNIYGICHNCQTSFTGDSED